MLGRLTREILACSKCPKRLTKDAIWPFPQWSHLLTPPFPKIMVVGQAPGYPNSKEREIAKQVNGVPTPGLFQKIYLDGILKGPSGKLLTEVFEASGINWKKVFFTNVVKCHPTKHRVSEKMVESCFPFLTKQVKIVRPKLYLLIGRIACGAFGLNGRMSMLHGSYIERRRSILVPAYHPSYIQRQNKSESDKLKRSLIQALRSAKSEILSN